MPQELQIKPWFDTILSDTNFINTSIACKIGIEFMLSELLLKGDLSRVLYSKEDISFRRRTEQLGLGYTKGSAYNQIGLDLPFAIYSQNGQLEPDDRGSTQNAGQIVLGKMQADTGINVKSAAVKVKYEATVFFSRRDDVTVASQLVYWETQPKFPLYVVLQYRISGWPIDIPVYITIDSFDADVQYKEKDWLEKSKVFPINISMTVRTYQTLIDVSNSNIKLPLRFSGLYHYNDEGVVFTNNTVLLWANDKWTAPNRNILPESRMLQSSKDGYYPALVEANKGEKPWIQLSIKNLTQSTQVLLPNKYNYDTLFNTYIIEVVEKITIKENDEVLLPIAYGSLYGYDNVLKQGTLLNIDFIPSINGNFHISIPDSYIKDDKQVDFFYKGNDGIGFVIKQDEVDKTIQLAVAGYFEPSTSITLSEYIVSNISDTSLDIEWKLTDELASNFKSINLYCPGILNVTLEKQGITNFTVLDLHPASIYEFTLILSSIDNSAITYKLKATTAGLPSVGKSVSLRSNLIGKSFINKPLN